MVKKTKELHSLRRAGLGHASLQLSRQIFMFDAETWEEEKKKSLDRIPARTIAEGTVGVGLGSMSRPFGIENVWVL